MLSRQLKELRSKSLETTSLQEQPSLQDVQQQRLQLEEAMHRLEAFQLELDAAKHREDQLRLAVSAPLWSQLLLHCARAAQTNAWSYNGLPISRKACS